MSLSATQHETEIKRWRLTSNLWLLGFESLHGQLSYFFLKYSSLGGLHNLKDSQEPHIYLNEPPLMCDRGPLGSLQASRWSTPFGLHMTNYT